MQICIRLLLVMLMILFICFGLNMYIRFDDLRFLHIYIFKYLIFYVFVQKNTVFFMRYQNPKTLNRQNRKKHRFFFGTIFKKKQLNSNRNENTGISVLSLQWLYLILIFSMFSVYPKLNTERTKRINYY